MSCRNLILQPRDYSVLRGLYEGRVLTIPQAARLYFKARTPATKKRLRALESEAYIRRLNPQVSRGCSVFTLARRGYHALFGSGLVSELPKLDWPTVRRRLEVSCSTLNHELNVIDVKAAVQATTERSDSIEKCDFCTWPRLIQFECQRPIFHKGEIRLRTTTLAPDGLITLKSEVGTMKFYLELDRGTESHQALLSKALGYRDRQQRLGETFRVLIVTLTPERRNNLAESLQGHSTPILGLVWIATLDEVLMNPFAPIWLTPRNYRQVLTQANLKPPTRPLPHSRNAARDLCVEALAKMLPLLPTEKGRTQSPTVTRLGSLYKTSQRGRSVKSKDRQARMRESLTRASRRKPS